MRYKTIDEIVGTKDEATRHSPFREFAQGFCAGARGNLLYNFERNKKYCEAAVIGVPDESPLSRDHIDESLQSIKMSRSGMTGYVFGNITAYPAKWAMDLSAYTFQACILASRMF